VLRGDGATVVVAACTEAEGVADGDVVVEGEPDEPVHAAVTAHAIASATCALLTRVEAIGIDGTPRGSHGEGGSTRVAAPVKIAS
jgi:hypothetical protein